MEPRRGFEPVNSVLLNYVLEKHSAFAEHFVNFGEREAILRDICNFFFSNLLEKRLHYADKVVHYLLKTHDTEEFNEFRRDLTRLEIDRRLYSQYRDHTNHTLLVFLLGAYLFEKLDIFQKYYKEQCIKEKNLLDANIPNVDNHLILMDDFMFRWLYTSLLHDIGYTFSSIDDELDKELCPLLPRTLNIIKSFFDKYVRYWFPPEKRAEIEPDVIDLNLHLGISDSEIPKFENGKVSPDDIDKIISWLILCPFFKQISAAISQENCFEIMDCYSRKIAGRYVGMFSQYFVYLATKGMSSRSGTLRVFDHGILSALLYMKMVSFAFLMTRKFQNLDLSAVRSDRQKEMVKSIKENTKKFVLEEKETYYEFVAIAWAIALHSLRPIEKVEREIALTDEIGELLDEERKLRSFKDSLFPIKPDENFLGCLLTLADIIQDWDRDRLRLTDYTSPQTSSLQNYEIGIEVRDQRIKISYIDNEITREQIEKMKQELDILAKEIRDIIDFEAVSDSSISIILPRDEADIKKSILWLKKVDKMKLIYTLDLGKDGRTR